MPQPAGYIDLDNVREDDGDILHGTKSEDNQGFATTDRPSGAQRLVALDLLKGVLMPLMLYDHLYDFFVVDISPMRWETWFVPAGWDQSQRTADFILRQCTHIVATGFFLTMGIGIVFLLQSRQRRGWGTGRLLKFFAIRGLVIATVDIFLSFVVSLMRWTPTIVLQVMFSLGSNMAIVGAFVVVNRLLCERFRWWPSQLINILLCLAIFLVLQFTIPEPQTEEHMHSMTPLAFVWWPLFQQHLRLQYPVFPWTAMTLLGVSIGWACQDTNETAPASIGGVRRPRGLAWLYLIGSFSLVAFVIFRSLYVFADVNVGNIRVINRSNSLDAFVFFSTTKYPPSLMFQCWGVAVTSLLVFLLDKFGVSRVDRWFMRPIAVFGSVPLFFYCAHMVVAMTLRGPGKIEVNSLYVIVYTVIALFVLYPLCRAYARFKKGKSADSLWRLF